MADPGDDSAVAAAIAAVDDVIDDARAELEQLVRIPSISADPRAQRRRARRAPKRPPSCCAAHGLENVRHRGSRRFAAVRHRRVDARRPGVADRAAVRASRRAAAGHRRELGERSVRARGARPAVSTGGARPTTRPARSRTRTRSAPGSTSSGAPPVQRARADRGRGGDRVADPPRLPHRPPRRAPLRRARAGRRRATGRSASRASPIHCAVSRRPTSSCGRSTVPQHSGMAGGAIPDPVMALSRVLASLVDEHGDVAFDGALDGLLEPAPKERLPIAGFDDEPERFRPRVRRAARVSSSRATPPSRCTNGCGCGRASPSSGSTATRSRARRTRSSPGPRPGVSLRLGPGQEPERVLGGPAVARRAARSLGTRVHVHRRSKVRPRGRPTRPAPRSTRPRRALHAGFGVEPVLDGRRRIDPVRRAVRRRVRRHPRAA